MNKPKFYFTLNENHFISVDKFSLGKEINISMEIKPRSVDGILVAMLTKKNFLILEMKNGSISFSVDTGKGSISTSFTPASPYFLCDGQWHRVTGLYIFNMINFQAYVNVYLTYSVCYNLTVIIIILSLMIIA